MSREKKPIISKEKKDEILEARVVLAKSTKDLKKVFDAAAKISGDAYPKSSTPDGEGDVKRVLNGGQKLYYTLQDRKFPELFNVLGNTVFFTEKMTKLLSPVTYESFLKYAKAVYKGEDKKGILNEAEERVVIKALYDFCEQERDVVLPAFDLLPDAKEEEKTFSKSDLIINMINSLIMKSGMM